MPVASHTEHFIVDALREAGALAVSLVADEDAQIIGHVAVSRVAIEGADGAKAQLHFVPLPQRMVSDLRVQLAVWRDPRRQVPAGPQQTLFIAPDSRRSSFGA